MAGSTSVSRSFSEYGKGIARKRVEKVTVSFIADASAATIPNTSIDLQGYIVKIVTNPGSTAPQSNYDVTLGDPDDSALDVLASVLLNRHTSSSEQVYPAIAGAPGTVSSFKIFVSGTHTLVINGNNVNSATGDIHFYLVDEA